MNDCLFIQIYIYISQYLFDQKSLNFGSNEKKKKNSKLNLNIFFLPKN